MGMNARQKLMLVSLGLVIGAGRQGVAGSDAAAQASKPVYPKGFIVEGPLPEGFPPPSEVGKIVEKSYPLCRTYSAEGNQAFSRCFLYLVLHKHEMTTPVIMDYKPRNSASKPKSRRESSTSWRSRGCTSSSKSLRSTSRSEKGWSRWPTSPGSGY